VPEKSIVRYCLQAGLQTFAISWKNPSAAEHGFGLDTYVAALEQAVDSMREITGSEDVNVWGSCSGGITTSAFLAHLAARGEAIKGRLAQILCRRLHEFRLLRLLLGTAGNSEVWQRVIGLQSARRTVERGAGDAERLRLRPHHLQPLLERRVGGVRGRREQDDRNQD